MEDTGSSITNPWEHHHPHQKNKEVKEEEKLPSDQKGDDKSSSGTMGLDVVKDLDDDELMEMLMATNE